MTREDRARRLLGRLYGHVVRDRRQVEDEDWGEPSWGPPDEAAAAEWSRQETSETLEAHAVAEVLPGSELDLWRARFDAAIAAPAIGPDEVADPAGAARAETCLERLLKAPGFDGAVAAAWELGLLDARGLDTWRRRRLAFEHPGLELEAVPFPISGGLFWVGEDERTEEERAEDAAAEEELDFEEGARLLVVPVPLVRVEGACVTTAMLHEHAVVLTVHALRDGPLERPGDDPWSTGLPEWLPAVALADDVGTDYGRMRFFPGSGSWSEGGPSVLRPTLQVRVPVPAAATRLSVTVGRERIDVPLPPGR